MSIDIAAKPAGPARRKSLVGGLALPTALSVAVLLVLAGAPVLRGRAMLRDDNDSMLRLVEVRDFLAGQGWFDLTQYRMGLSGGFEMHWSRLIDAPLAALILVGRTMGLETGAAESLALIAWPVILSAVALATMIVIARRIAGDGAVLPASVLGIAALFASGQFRPGAIDHHSAQAVLALVSVAALSAPRLSAGTGALAGIATALMTGIGAETHLYVALAAIGAALIFALVGRPARAFAIAYGLTFAAALAAIFLGVTAPGAYGSIVCDAISAAQVAPGVAGGVALAAVAAFAPDAGRAARFALLFAASLAAALAAGPFALPCLADPLAGIDPLVRRYWLDLVDEARPLLSIGLVKPAIGLSFGVPPLIALAHLAWRFRRGSAGLPLIALFVAVGAAYAIALAQVRGGVFALILATAPLASFVAATRERVREAPTLANQLAMAAAWIVSMNIVWAILGLGLDRSASRPPEAVCTEAGALAALGGEPRATVLAISNLGSAILLHTDHRAVAGPYHRNVAGMRAAISALIAPAGQAEAAVRATGATLVAVCPDDPETLFYRRAASGGFAAELAQGRTPPWLTPVEPANGPLRLYRLAPGG